MASVVEICNMALGHVGVAREISALDEGSTEADQCARYYEQCRDWLLARYDWDFARQYQALALVATEPNADWGYAYRYPTDCLKLIRLVSGNRKPERIPWRLGHDSQGLLIYTDTEDAVALYVARVENTERFSPAFVEALAWRLATQIAIPLSRSREERDYAVRRFEELELPEAAAESANEAGWDAPLEAEAIRERE